MTGLKKVKRRENCIQISTELFQCPENSAVRRLQDHSLAMTGVLFQKVISFLMKIKIELYRICDGYFVHNNKCINYFVSLKRRYISETYYCSSFLRYVPTVTEPVLYVCISRLTLLSTRIRSRNAINLNPISPNDP